jgi:hypothetical protein
MTVLALEHLVHSLDITDLLIVDDFSLDGTGNFDTIATEIAYRCRAGANHLCFYFQLITCEKKDSL